MARSTDSDENGSELEVSTATAIEVGKDLVHDSAFGTLRLKTSGVFCGRSAAGAVYALPRRIDENLDLVQIHPVAGAR